MLEQRSTRYHAYDISSFYGEIGNIHWYFQWLRTEALANNPKVEVTPDGKYMFKPPYKIRDRKGLLKLLRQYDLKGLGGVLLDDVTESLPNYDKVLKVSCPFLISQTNGKTSHRTFVQLQQLNNDIVYITRPIDKKKVLFYNDRTAATQIDEEFQKLWRAVAVDGIDDNKIEEYLEKQGIRSMQDTSVKTVAKHNLKRKQNKKKTHKKPRDNEHLADILETYDQ